MATKIAIANMKGGIGKTTTALCICDNLQNKGLKVLLIDTDPQSSATSVYKAKVEDTETLADLMYDNIDAAKCIQKTEYGDIIASDRILMEADTKVPVDTDRFYHLSDACKSIEDMYDVIILDCPPGNGIMLGNVLSYANYVIMPITCDRFGIQGMVEFTNVMKQYTKRINPSLKILGVLITKYKGRLSLTRDLEDTLIPSIVEKMGTKLYKTKIRESVKCQEAQALNLRLSKYAPNVTTAVDYSDFTDELLKDLED